MNVSITRTRASVTFASLAAGATYVPADDNGKNYVYTKGDSKDAAINNLLALKNRSGKQVGFAVRNDGRPVFHFLDKQVAPATATGVSVGGTVNFKA